MRKTVAKRDDDLVFDFGEEEEQLQKRVIIKDRFGTHRRVKTIVKGPGVLFWEGPSLLDSKPIVVICNGFKLISRNRKTGPMIQAYILRQDVDPWTAILEGKDASICGNCIHRAQKPGGGGRSCYVQVYPWVTTVWHAYKRGSYTPMAEFEGIGDPFDGRYVRVGTYGDPAAVPTAVWERMLTKAKGWTMYSHLWQDCDQDLQRYAMASVDTPAEYDLAVSRGWRTFRTRFQSEQVRKGEAICPASEEAEKKAQCIACRLCDGMKEGKDNRRNIAIIAHGSGGRWYEAARSSMNARGQGLLPITNNR